jgi:hypothetical protein
MVFEVELVVPSGFCTECEIGMQYKIAISSESHEEHFYSLLFILDSV